ncbi:RING finger protein 10 [Zootermopsis nevadensis]|uniref:E3 ubiquitin-protein ligase RNF10 n=2 Tax=Zootermopsis nevadensis TaxID=136037 RepID=A0A067QK15_ZOONE|nr:RING finger protein 10 [Zootermopsis nevadensis]
MLEDYTMEKKPSGRSAQAPGKANGTELKKSQDAVNSKLFPRAVRRREPNGSSSTKFDPNRKTVLQKSKSFDKRPRPRGQYYNCGKENTKVVPDEIGSVFVPGNKKQNLNHLLNFHYAPREGVVPGSGHWHSFPSGVGRHGSARWLTSTHKHKYNKEQFLQANCQFVVKADGNYTPYTSNPDVLVNWDFIEQIRFQSSEMLSCPICLYPPVAAKMTRCGHIYCWPCMLHYLALSDKTWRKCPICYEAVHKQDLRSVIAVPHMQLSVGEEVTMRLMKRERGSLVALPVDQCGIRPIDQLLSVSETVVDTVHSKLLVATPQEVMSIVNHERNELQKQLSEEENCPETCFIEQAINLLSERHAALSKEILTVQTENDKPELNVQKSSAESKPDVVYNSAFDDDYAALDNSPILTSLPSDENQSLMALEQNASCNEPSCLKLSGENTDRCRYESVSSEGMSSDDGNTAFRVEDLEIPTNLQVHTRQSEVQPVKHFYFYQAEDGQHIYLHALNVRMLQHYYGSLEHCPPTLTGCIIEKESGSMTEELRRRLRYLQHLPITCQFEVAEIQLKPPIVSKETIDHFQDQLEVRRQRRQRRARDERRREKKIIEEENRRWGRYPTPHIRIESQHHFPQCGIDCDSAVTNFSASVQSSMANIPTPSHESISSATVEAENLSLESQMYEEVHVLPKVGSPDLPGMSFARV